MGAGVNRGPGPGGAASSADHSEDDDAMGWVLLPPERVPERWRARSRPVALVPLLVAEMVVSGASIPQMANAVGLSPRGVQHRLARLRERLGVATTAELVARLARCGFPIASKAIRRQRQGTIPRRIPRMR